IVVDRNVVVKARSHVPEYQLKISQGTGTTITVNRSFSIKGGKGILHQGDPIYQGDQLIISVSANTAAYNTPVLRVNNGAFTSGGVYKVSNPINNELLISSSATVKEYKLTKTQGDGTTLTIQRTASPIGKGILGDLENNAKIYYNDTLKVTVSAKTGYKDAKIVAGGTSLNSGGVKTITGNLAISSSASKITYNVTYNANGGSGAPGAQTKVYGTNLTLSSTKPTRTGYTFMNWNTKADGKGTSYNAGASYSANAALNLYAIYNPNTYSISYNLDGGSYGENYPTSATYDTAFTVNNPTKNGHTFTGWNITGMDSVTHNYGSSTTTNTSINGTKATSFKNLRATSGTVTFTAEWEPDRQNQCFLLAGKGTGKNGTDLSAANYAYDYEGGGGIIFPRTDALGMWFELNPYATATQIDFRWKGASNSPNTWYSASRYKPSSSIRGYKGPYTIEVYEAGHVGEYQYLQDTVIIKGIWESDDRYYGTWSCEHGKSGSAFLD
ncbi:MAG: InlB B-repeat-containing protein, partial [Bacilli bacterium]|nr:InlB B-repeat-containing protein [Bacilli bacterium]